MSETRSEVDEFVLRPMQPIDVPNARALSAELHWPHRVEDWAQMYRLGVGCVLENDRADIVGTAFTALQGKYATIGLIIVRGDHKRRGLGERLTRWALEAAGERSAVLNATEAGLALYEKLGFERVCSICQHQAATVVAPGHCAVHAVRPARPSDMAWLLDIANKATGFDRSRVVADLCTFARRVLVLENKSRIEGFGISRPFGLGYHIGPVVAAEAGQARDIVASLLTELAGEFVRFDCPVDCGLEMLLQAAGLQPLGMVEQMVRGDRHMAANMRQFALVTQALG